MSQFLRAMTVVNMDGIFYITFDQLIIQTIKMFVQFYRNYCGKHKLIYQYICLNENCQCNVRLCLKCAQQHQNKKDIEDDFIKETVFHQKLEIQTQIIAKQYANLENYKQDHKEICLLNSKNEDSIKIVEIMMKAINQDKRAIFNNLEDFNFNHLEVKKKLAKVKSNNYSKYLSSIKNKVITPIIVYLSSQIGVERLRKKVLGAHNSIQKYQDFINAVQKYGNNSQTFLEGLGFKESQLFKNMIKGLMSRWRGTRLVEIDFDRARQNTGRRRQGSNSRENRLRNQSPSKKINVVSTPRRPKTNADKEN